MNRNNMYRRILKGIFVIAGLGCLNAYSQYLQNPSLEGELGSAQPPNFWQTDQDWSDPDLVYQYPIVSPTYFPVDSNIFCLFRARGATYAQGSHPPRTREYLYQELLTPLEEFSCFELNAHLCYNPSFGVYDTEDPDRGYPLKFQIWGANAPGKEEALLYASENITNSQWKPYSFVFNTYDLSYSYILLTVMWDTIDVKKIAYNGMMLVDNLDLYKIEDIPETLQDTMFYRGDNETELAAWQGEAYIWMPDEPLIEPDLQFVVLKEYVEQISVVIINEEGCGSIYEFHILLDCDTLYPPNQNRVHNYYYEYEGDLILEAANGTAYNWEPANGLSAYDIQAPRLLEFNDFYWVTVSDRYNCSFTESFNIIADCETLYPGGSITVVDTTLAPNSSLELIPLYGSIKGEWTPDLFLDCADCQTPTSTPQTKVSYTVQLEDEFKCLHQEVFILKTPIRIPNVITPNADTYNDCFEVFGLPDQTSFQLYDKQGRLLYEMDDYGPDDCWEGVDQKGNNLPAGNYWYVFVHPQKGTLKKGFVLIKR